MSKRISEIKRDIIDNVPGNTMDAILNSAIPNADRLDISTGYFNLGGYGKIRHALENSFREGGFSMRLLLGRDALVQDMPFEKHAEEYRKLQKGEDATSAKNDLNDAELDSESMDATNSLIRLLEKQKDFQVRLGASRFNHSKCYIVGDNSAIIGSSNLTTGGMVGNYELNAGVYQPGAIGQTREWFDRMWGAAENGKSDLVDILRQSKFGTPPDPYDVYMKMLFERFKPLLAEMDDDTRLPEMLTEFQRDAVRTGLFITAEYGGTIIADATGLGKTNIGIEIVRQKVLKEGKKVLLIAPAQVLHSMWEQKLKDVDIKVRETLTTESLGRDGILEDLGKYKNIDLVLIDESQNFRSKAAARRENLMKLMSVGRHKQVVMLTATPVNNTLMDLYYQLSIITGGEDAYFHRTVGIPDLYTHMRKAANSDGLQEGLTKIQQLLDHVMVRRTRSYIQDVYKNDRINGAKITFPEHEYRPINYSLSELFGNIFETIVENIRSLTMAPYGIEQYNAALTEEDKKKERVLAHLQVILLLKRFESSHDAARVSLKNRISMYRRVKIALDSNKILRPKDFNHIMQKFHSSVRGSDSGTDEEQEEYLIRELEKIPQEDIGKEYDLEGLKRDVDSDLDRLEYLLAEVEKITIDTKLQEVEKTIMRDQILENEGGKVLVFTEYTATAKYVTKNLKSIFKGKSVECITGSSDPKTRMNYIRRFAPKSNLTEDEKLNDKEIDILVSTEVLSEGQNLQDCNYIINYDLPWNPMRIVQRTGRVDRLTSRHGVVHSRACYPDKELDAVLKLMGKLLHKIDVVNKTVGLAGELLGTVPEYKQYNGSIEKRIRVLSKSGDGSDTIVKQMERESDLMPANTPINELSRCIKERGIDSMKEISMGRRSGKRGEGQHAVLAYLQEKPERRVYFVMYDYKKDMAIIPDDDTEAILNASCGVDTPKHLPMDGEDNAESFRELLMMDAKARAAIIKNKGQVLNDVKYLKTKKKQKHEKNVTEIKIILGKEVGSGNITESDAEEVLHVATSDYIRPWVTDIDQMLAEYQRGKDVGALVSGILALGKHLAIASKPRESEEVPAEPADVKLQLVGAMFVTGDEFDSKIGKKGLDGY